MCSEPLEDYFSQSGMKPMFRFPHTALWRGYVGRWEIIDDRLFLTHLEGLHEHGSEVTVATVFPGFPDKVFAQWYSGTLRIPQGEMLNYVHMGYGSTYERDLLLEVEWGVVVATKMRHNEIEATDDDDSLPF
jgi:hypothetical protein